MCGSNFYETDVIRFRNVKSFGKFTTVKECCGAFSTKLADVCGVLCGHAKTRAKEDYPGMEKFGLNYIGVVCM